MPADRDQPVRAIAGYVRSVRRTPRLPPIEAVAHRRPGPGAVRVLEDAARYELDLSRARAGAPQALGQLIRIAGVVEDGGGRPIPGAVLEIWQANASGKYLHENDPSPSPLDPNFLGTGRLVTDGRGRFSLRTIKPGAYAVPYEERGGAVDWWRPPHVHFSIFGSGFASRLVTQLYFPGDPLNERDLLLNSIASAPARRRMIAALEPDQPTAPSAPLRFTHRFVLGGAAETPFEGR
jgi:protocatechuate 3,4-dioxygenase beta subunit